MIIGSHLFDELDYSRIACITGSLSAGKTRLAFEIPLHYWHQNFRVLSNARHNFVPLYDERKVITPWGPQDVRDLLYKKFVILDEGGSYIRKAAVASQIIRSAGKANYYVIFPGKRLPHADLQEMVIEPVFDFYTNFGIPAILWSYKINATKRYSRNFWQVFPALVHGTYSTLTSSAAIDEFEKKAENTVQWLAKMEGQDAGAAREAGLDGLADDLATLGAGLS